MWHTIRYRHIPHSYMLDQFIVSSALFSQSIILIRMKWTKMWHFNTNDWFINWKFWLFSSIYLITLKNSTFQGKFALIHFNSYLRSETNSCSMFISNRVNWTWWRRASFHLKAFPVLIKQVHMQKNWFLSTLDLYRSFFFSFYCLDHNSKSFFPHSTNHIYLLHN